MALLRIALVIEAEGPMCDDGCNHQDCWAAESVIGTLIDMEDVRDVTACVVTEIEPSHPSGCICADCSGAELTAEND